MIYQNWSFSIYKLHQRIQKINVAENRMNLNYDNDREAAAYCCHPAYLIEIYPIKTKKPEIGCIIA